MARANKGSRSFSLPATYTCIHNWHEHACLYVLAYYVQTPFKQYQHNIQQKIIITRFLGHRQAMT